MFCVSFFSISLVSLMPLPYSQNLNLHIFFYLIPFFSFSVLNFLCVFPCFSFLVLYVFLSPVSGLAFASYTPTLPLSFYYVSFFPFVFNLLWFMLDFHLCICCSCHASPSSLLYIPQFFYFLFLSPYAEFYKLCLCYFTLYFSNLALSFNV